MTNNSKNNMSVCEQLRTKLPEMPMHLKYYIYATVVVNVCALIYSVYNWYITDDFSLMQWPLIIWSMVTNVLNIFVNFELNNMCLGNMSGVFASIIFSIYWTIVAILKFMSETKKIKF